MSAHRAMACPVCRRVRAKYEHLVCPACWGKLSTDVQNRLVRLQREENGSKDHRYACGAAIADLKLAREEERPFGYDVDVLCGRPPTVKSFHWRGTEATMRRKAALQSLFIELVSMRPLSRRQWIQGYGLGRM